MKYFLKLRSLKQKKKSSFELFHIKYSIILWSQCTQNYTLTILTQVSIKLKHLQRIPITYRNTDFQIRSEISNVLVYDNQILLALFPIVLSHS